LICLDFILSVAGGSAKIAGGGILKKQKVENGRQMSEIRYQKSESTGKILMHGKARKGTERRGKARIVGNVVSEFKIRHRRL